MNNLLWRWEWAKPRWLTGCAAPTIPRGLVEGMCLFGAPMVKGCQWEQHKIESYNETEIPEVTYTRYSCHKFKVRLDISQVLSGYLWISLGFSSNKNLVPQLQGLFFLLLPPIPIWGGDMHPSPSQQHVLFWMRRPQYSFRDLILSPVHVVWMGLTPSQAAYVVA